MDVLIAFMLGAVLMMLYKGKELKIRVYHEQIEPDKPERKGGDVALPQHLAEQAKLTQYYMNGGSN